MIDGVCGGIAEYFHIQPTIVRIAWIIMTLFHGTGFWLYLLAMILIPVNPEHKNLKADERTRRNPEMLIGILLIAVGLLFLAHWFRDAFDWNYPFWGWWMPFPLRILLPIALILFGLAAMARALRPQAPENSKTKNMEKKSNNTRALQRSETNKMLGGVCGGLGSYLHMDPTFVRLAYVLFTIGTALFLGLLLYVLLVIFIPKETASAS